MDVYFIPVGTDRYELYCDEAVEPEDLGPDVPSTGRFASLIQTFRTMLDQAEQRRLTGDDRDRDRPRTWAERLKDQSLRWLAEKVAEQRLLWRLRNQSEVVLHYPDDVSEEMAVGKARAELQREADRHLKWTIIDATAFVVSGALALIPGPNILAYYFGFRLVGHYLSRRGARHALVEARWRTCASAHLSRLRRAIALAGSDRDREVHQVATDLHLPHLAKFFERTAIKTA